MASDPMTVPEPDTPTVSVRRVLAALMLVPAALVAAVLVFAGVMALMLPVLFGGGEAAVKPWIFTEAYIRAFVATLALTVVLTARHRLRPWILAERRRLWVAGVLAAGVTLAFLDPHHKVSEEYNWIRYATSGVLVTAGVMGLRGALGRETPAADRLLGLLFGTLFLAAAADELLQIHERAGQWFGSSDGTGVASQDWTTLIAALGAVAALAAFVLAVRSGALGMDRFRDPRYRLPTRFFATAVAAFLLAMLLDTFDVHLVAMVERVIPVPEGLSDPRLIARGARQLANTLEELLEYTAAVCLLFTVVTLFRPARTEPA